MSISVNQNNLYTVREKTTEKPEESAKASFKGSPEQEEHDGMSTTAKAALVTAGLALATVGAIYGCKAYKKMNLEKPLKELIGKPDDLAGMDRSALEELKKKIESAIDTAKKGGLSDDNAQVKSLSEKLSKIEEKLNAPAPKKPVTPPITLSADAIDALRKEAQDLVQKYADVAKLTDEADAKAALNEVGKKMIDLSKRGLAQGDSDYRALVKKWGEIQNHITQKFDIPKLRTEANALVQKYADVAKLTDEADAKAALKEVEDKINEFAKQNVNSQDADVLKLIQKQQALEKHIQNLPPTPAPQPTPAPAPKKPVTPPISGTVKPTIPELKQEAQWMLDACNDLTSDAFKTKYYARNVIKRLDDKINELLSGGVAQNDSVINELKTRKSDVENFVSSMVSTLKKDSNDLLNKIPADKDISALDSRDAIQWYGSLHDCMSRFEDTKMTEYNSLSDKFRLVCARLIDCALENESASVKSDIKAIEAFFNQKRKSEIGQFTKFMWDTMKDNSFKGNETKIRTTLNHLYNAAKMVNTKGEYVFHSRILFSPAGRKYPAEFECLGEVVQKAGNKYQNLFNRLSADEKPDGLNKNLVEDLRMYMKTKKKNGTFTLDDYIPVVSKADGQKLPSGTVFSDNGFLYVNVNGKAEPLDPGLTRDDLNGILNPVKRYFGEQGGIGDCYLLSAVNGMLQSPEEYAQLLKRIHIDNGEIIVKMPKGSTTTWENASYPVDITLSDGRRVNVGVKENMFKYLNRSDLQEDQVVVALEQKSQNSVAGGVLQSMYAVPNQKQQYQSKSPTLVQAIEKAYGAHRKYIMADKYVRKLYARDKAAAQAAFEKLSQDIDKYVVTTNAQNRYTLRSLDEINAEALSEWKKKGGLGSKPDVFTSADDYYKSSGTLDEVYKFFTENKKPVRKYDPQASDFYKTDVRDALSKQNPVKFFATVNCKKRDLNSKKYLYRRHAYMIQNYDPKTDVVTYINPWNAALTFDMKLDDLHRQHLIGKIAVCGNL